MKKLLIITGLFAALSGACTRKALPLAPALYITAAMQEPKDPDHKLEQNGILFTQQKTTNFDRDMTVMRLKISLLEQDKDVAVKNGNIKAYWEAEGTHPLEVITLDKNSSTIAVIDRGMIDMHHKLILVSEAKGYETIVKTIELPVQASHRIVLFPIRMKNLNAKATPATEEPVPEKAEEAKVEPKKNKL